MAETILLTGISGFIAKHIALRALERGHRVRGTIRDAAKGAEVRQTLAAHLTDPSAIDRLEFASADLLSDAGWAEAFSGISALIHCASPFPLAQPKDPDELIRPALEGTTRVLRAAKAAGVTRVVLTSSCAAIMNETRDKLETEDDWADLTDPGATAYIKSKTLAEKKAWDIARSEGLSLTTINPGLVLGPPLDDRIGASLTLVERVMQGRDPMHPAYGVPVVDVRDVAEMHIRALDRQASAGKRIIASAGSLWMADMGRILKTEYPSRRIATRQAPVFVVRLVALWDGAARAILPKLGHIGRVSNGRAVEILGMEFIAPATALKASAEALLRFGILR